MSVIREEAPAKINLYLHVVGRRADGYHLLDSLVTFAAAGDTLWAEPAPGGELSLAIEGPFATALQADPAENLVLRAARLLAERLGRPAEVALRLEKRLPLASGIGGGSADAAAALRALGRLWGADMAVLRELAPRLGADVPVCLEGKPAFMRGVGEEITPAGALPPVAMVLVNPGVAVPTPAVFKARRGGFSAPARPVAWDSPSALIDWLRPLGNDLAAPAEALAPEIRRTVARLAATERCLLARMSGSGATCFGLYADEAAAETAAAGISEAEPGWWVDLSLPLPGRVRPTKVRAAGGGA